MARPSAIDPTETSLCCGEAQPLETRVRWHNRLTGYALEDPESSTPAVSGGQVAV